MALAGSCLVLAVSGACGDEDNPTGGANLRLTGSVSGNLRSDMDIDCSPPAEPGGRFVVSFDSDAGAPVGGRNLMALDVATPRYEGPKTYDLEQALSSDDQLAENFFLLFKEFDDQPLTWGQDPDAGGTITIDNGESSGRLSLQGWASAGDLKVNVEGTFRCGEVHRGQGPERGAG
jgi:hypothetical protein